MQCGPTKIIVAEEPKNTKKLSKLCSQRSNGTKQNKLELNYLERDQF
jgi:hypothetical protein